MIFQNGREIVPPFQELRVCVRHFLVFHEGSGSKGFLYLSRDFGEADIFNEWKYFQSIFLSHMSLILHTIGEKKMIYLPYLCSWVV